MVQAGRHLKYATVEGENTLAYCGARVEGIVLAVAAAKSNLRLSSFKQEKLGITFLVVVIEYDKKTSEICHKNGSMPKKNKILFVFSKISFGPSGRLRICEKKIDKRHRIRFYLSSSFA
jgi:hypothetical protein